MPADKSTREQEEGDGPSLATGRLMTFTLLVFSDRLPARTRTRALVALLKLAREVNREIDGTPPEEQFYPLEAAKEAERMGRTKGLSPEEVLEAMEWLLSDLPEAERPRARRALLEHFRVILREEGRPVPEWIRLGQERHGRWGDGPGEDPGEPPGPGTL